MYLIESPDTDLKQYLPADLSECKGQQYIDMAALILRYMMQEVSFDELKTHAVYKLMNMVPAAEVHHSDPKKQAEQEASDLNKYSNLYRISEKLESFFETGEDNQRVIKMNYLENPIPSYRPAWRTYYGPTDQFMNVKFGEYNDALRIFLEFDATHDLNLLYDLAAVLYRKKKPLHFIGKHLDNYDGDVRAKYNPNHVEKRAKAFKYAPIGFVYGVYLYFASFQKFISSAAVPWGGKVLDLSILFQPIDGETPSEDALPDIGMDSVMFMMAESGAFGSKTDLDNTNVWMVLVRMYDIRRKDIEQRKLEKQQEDDAKRNKT